MDKFKAKINSIRTIISGMKQDIQAYETSVDNYFKEIENLQEGWKGFDSESFINRTTQYKLRCSNYKLVMESYVSALEKFVSTLENNEYVR